MLRRKPTILKDFLFARPGAFWGAIAATGVAGVAEVVFPLLMQTGVDTALGSTSDYTLTQIGFAMLAMVAIILAGQMLALVLEAWLFSKASLNLRKRIYDAIERMPLDRLTRHRSGTLAFRATGDVSSMETHLSQVFGEAFFDTMVVLGAVLAMSLVDPWLTLLIVTVLAIASTVAHWFGERLPTYQRASQMLAARLSGRLQESIGGARTVRVLNGEPAEIVQLDRINDRIRRIDLSGGVLRAVVTPLWNFSEAFGILAVVWFGGSKVMEGTMTVGTLVAFLAYQQLLSGPINRIGAYYLHVQSLRGLLGRLSALLSDAREQSFSSELPDTGFTISLSNVTFRYPATSKNSLEGIDLTITPGEKIVLLGRNGAGKSTLIDILLRLYDPTSGQMLLGSDDVRNIDPFVWRSQMGAMLQETVLFHGTLAENLSVSANPADYATMEAAVVAAGGTHLLQRLPRGLDTPVGERGTTLSGGERQIIGLSRLIMRGPQIIILDEPTANLDGIILQEVIDAIEEFCKARTLLIVSHSQDLIKLAERAVVLDGGTIVADGSVQHVIETCPLAGELLGLPDRIITVGD